MSRYKNDSKMISGCPYTHKLQSHINNNNRLQKISNNTNGKSKFKNIEKTIGRELYIYRHFK